MTPLRRAAVGLVLLLVSLPVLGGGLTAAVAAAGGQDDAGRTVFSFADPEIREASGLAVVDGLFVTVNDSGDTGRVLTVDPATGETVGTTTWSGGAVDVEALAPGGDGTVWVGDLGDNRAERDSVTVRQVPVGRGEQRATSPAYSLVYPDGPHDAEALLRDPVTGRLLVATKALLGGTLWTTPARLDADAPTVLEPVGSVPPLVTDGAFLPDGEHLVLRDYARAVVLAWPGLEQVGSTSLPSQEQGEAVAVDDTGAAYVTSEGVGAAVLAVDLPVPAAAAASPTATATHPPTESREDRELPEATSTDRSAWPWFLSGLLGVGFLVVLLRSMRRPDRR